MDGVKFSPIESHIATLLIRLNRIGCDASCDDKYSITPNNMWKTIFGEYQNDRDKDLNKRGKSEAERKSDQDLYRGMDEVYQKIKEAIDRDNELYTHTRTIRKVVIPISVSVWWHGTCGLSSS